VVRTVDAAAELERQELCAVADAERRDAELEDRRVDARCTVDVHRCGAAGEDERDRIPAPQLLDGHAMRDELGEDPRLAHATRDQLRILPTQVDHEHRTLLRERIRMKLNQLSRAGNWVRLS